MKLLNEGKVAIIGLERVDFDAYPDLRIVGCNMTSTEHIDEECAKRGIKIISLKGETEFLRGIPSVAELTIWFMLELLRKPHNGRFIGDQLKDQCVAIFGMGRIGTQVYNRVSSFESRIISGDRLDGAKLEELLEKADILTIHIPLNKETNGIITEKYLRSMKKTAFVINTSRSQVIEKGIIEMAIKEGWIAGYGTDVVRDDGEMRRLCKLREDGFNVIITEHIGGNTNTALALTEDFILKKINDYAV